MIFACLAAAVLAPILTARYSIADLTPPELLPLGGYTARGGRKMDAGGEPLHCRTILLQSGPLRIAIVSVEMLTIPESLHREVVRRLPPGTELFLAATHTHCAPDSQMLNDRMTFALPGIAKHDPKWLSWYAEKIAGSILAAEKSEPRAIGALMTVQRTLDGNRGRRVGAVPIRQAYDVRGIDPESGSLEVRPLWFWYSAHAVFHGPEHNLTSGDWPGRVVQETGSHMALMGPIGDVSPAASGASSSERIANFWAGYRTSQVAWLHSDGKPAWAAAPFAWRSEPIQLPGQLHFQLFARQNKIPDALAESIVSRFAPREASVSAFRIGKMAVVGIPGEPTSALGRRIRDAGRNMGFELVLVVSHVNGWIGYLLEKDDFARGGYEASLDFYGPETAQRVYEAAERALRGFRLATVAKAPPKL